MTRAVLFDLDGTLVDSAQLWHAALTALGRDRHGRPASAVAVAAGAGALLGLAVADAVVTLGRRLRWPVEDAAADARWVEQHVCAGHRAGVRWRAGAVELVRAVRDDGVPTGLVTSSGRQVVDAVLADRRCPAFDVVVTGDDVPAAKPAPDPYLTAAGLLGVPPQGCVAVEDSAVGVASALAAGCAVVAVGRHAACPDGCRCTHVDALTDIVAEALTVPQTLASG